MRDVPALALLGLQRLNGRLWVTIEAPGGKSDRFEVDDAADRRLAGLRDVDRLRVASALADLYPPRERAEQSATDRRENRERLGPESVPSLPEPLRVDELGAPPDLGDAPGPEAAAWMQPVRRASRAIPVRMACEVAESVGPVDWLIRDFVEAESMAVLFGDPGACKSFVALSWAFCIAAGLPWHGQRTRQGVAVYCAGEGARGLGRRLKALAIRHRVELAGLPLAIVTAPVSWIDSHDVDALADALAEVERQRGPIAFVVVDTVARAMAGGDENGAADMGRFVAACDAIRARLRCALLAVAHSGHADKGRARGHSSLRGATDYEWQAVRETDGTIRFAATKIKDGEWPAPRGFRLATVELGLVDDEGRPVTSAVLEPCDLPEPTPPAKNWAAGKNQRLALDVLRETIDRHRANVTASGRDPSEARVSIDAWRKALDAAGVHRNRFHEVRAGLERAGLIRVAGGFVELAEDSP